MSRDDPIRAIGRPTPWTWDNAADGELVRRFKGGEKVKAIARAMGRPSHSISTRIDRLRDRGVLPYRNKAWTRREEAALLAAITGEGRPRYAPLVREFGRSRQAVRQRAVELRREARKRDEEDQYQMELRAE